MSSRCWRSERAIFFIGSEKSNTMLLLQSFGKDFADLDLTRGNPTVFSNSLMRR
jgi:hypothetical protein